MMYLYVGSIVAIMCIYATVLLDNCPGFARGGHGGPAAGGGDTLARPGNLYNKTYDPESGSVLSFGTLRRAHIDKTKVSRTSFYLRVGALGESAVSVQHQDHSGTFRGLNLTPSPCWMEQNENNNSKR